MIIIIIGQSGAGKSTAVKSNYLEPNMELKKQPIKHTTNEETCLIGDYKTDRRCVGTDTLPYDALQDIINFIKQNKDQYERIVAEGDRINNKKFFKNLLKLQEPLKIIIFKCSLEKSKKRLPNQNPSFIKTTKTKTENIAKYLEKNGIPYDEVET